MTKLGILANKSLREIMSKDPIKSISNSLPPTVFKLGLVSFFADVASEMLYPLTPIFLSTVLGSSMSSLGLIEGVAEAIASLMKVYSGAWSDKITKRKPFILAGYFLGAIAKPLIGFSNHWLEVLFARGIDRTGKGLRSAPRDAWISESVPSDQIGAAFGWHRAMDTLGAVLGPLLALVILNSQSLNLRSIYFWSIIPGFLSIVVLFSIKEHPLAIVKNNAWQNPFNSWPLMSADFKKYLLGWSIFSITNSSDVFLIMKAKQSGLSTQTIVMLFCAFNLIYATSSPYLGKLSDQVNRKVIIVFGLFTFALVYCGFGFARELWQFSILFVCYGFYMGATDGIGKALAIDLTPANLKATGLGILGTISGLSTLVASLVAGVLWDHVDASAPFLLASIGATIAALIILSSVEFKQS